LVMDQWHLGNLFELEETETPKFDGIGQKFRWSEGGGGRKVVNFFSVKMTRCDT